MAGTTLTKSDGPVVISEKTLRALLAIRKEKLLPELYGEVAIARSNFEAIAHDASSAMREAPAWLRVIDDQPEHQLPPRVADATASEAATLRAALAGGASLVLLENPIKERAKFSTIKCEGTLSILVSAYKFGLLSAVQPMVKALQALGHGDVLPDQQMLDALWEALDRMQ